MASSESEQGTGFVERGAACYSTAMPHGQQAITPRSSPWGKRPVISPNAVSGQWKPDDGKSAKWIPCKRTIGPEQQHSSVSNGPTDAPMPSMQGLTVIL